MTAGLERFLETWGPAGARANRLLQDIGFSDSPSWPASRLTPTGSPLEFGFTEAGGGLRYTVEVGSPGVNAERRLSDVCEFVSGRGFPPPPGDLLDRVTDLQAAGLLTYGAWLGVRHDGAGDRLKIYAEVPTAGGPAVEDWMNQVLGAPLRLPGPPPRIKMIGLDAGSSRVEVYYASTDVLRTGVSMALNRAGLSGAPASILSVIGGMTSVSAGARLPGRDVGFSYAVTQGTHEVAFTLYLVAQKLFGDDQSCTEWIAGRLPGHGDLMPILPATPAGITHHGMVGLTVAPGVARPLLSTGVAAPWKE